MARQPNPAHRGLALAAVGLATFMTSLDNTVVNVARPGPARPRDRQPGPDRAELCPDPGPRRGLDLAAHPGRAGGCRRRLGRVRRRRGPLTRADDRPGAVP